MTQTSLNQFYIFLFLFTFSNSINAQLEPLGHWKDYSSYNSLVSIEKVGNTIYAASANGIMVADLSDNSIELLTKIQALSDININTIAYNHSTNDLVVGYKNGNIDIISGNKTINISSIKTSSIVGDKTINHIFFKDNIAYLSAGFGIIALDLIKREVKDSYVIGPMGTYLNIAGINILNDTIYAATNDGIYKAYEFNNFLNDYNSWERLDDFPVSTGNFSSIDRIGSKLVVSYEGGSGNSDTIYYRDATGWKRLDAYSGISIEEISVSGGVVIINRYDTVISLDSNLNFHTTFTWYDSFWKAKVNDILYDGTYFWTADHVTSFVQVTSDYVASIFTQFWRGNYKNKSNDIDVVNGHLWGATGYVTTSNWSSTFSLDGIYHYDIANDKWESFLGECFGSSGCIYDMIGVAIDPSNPSTAYACSFAAFTLGEYSTGGIKNKYDSSNSSVQISLTHNDRYAIADATFDQDNNMWAVNSWANNPLILKTPNDDWYAFYAGNEAKDKIISKIMVDQFNGYKWMLIKDQNIIVYNTGESITNDNDDQHQIIQSGAGNGNLHSTPICFAEDLDGEVWIGTEEGVTVIYNPINIFEGGDYDAQRIKIEQDGNIEYLLSTERINCIEVDGGNRKWIGTQSSGVFVVSADGQELIHNFNFDNSPIFDNQINDIAIDQQSGEVFILTEGGMLSYRGVATAGGIKFDDVYAFPNPVKPEYTGDVVIKGLMRDTDVRIADLTGNVVYAGKSIGGQALWNRKNLDGIDVQSGVYLVMLAGPDGSNKEVTKILILD